MHDDNSQPENSTLEEQALSKQRRKLKARREGGSRSVWFGLGMFGLVGWSVAVPALAGIALGAWLDTKWPSRVSWRLTLLLVGVAVGFWNANRWMHREAEED